MEVIFPPGSAFNRALGIGFSYEGPISEENARTLAYIISESALAVSDPYFFSLRNKLEETNMPGAELLPAISIADWGGLVGAFVSENNGTEVILGVPQWCTSLFESVKNTFLVVLSRTYNEFINRINFFAKWIFPLVVHDAKTWLSKHYQNIRIDYPEQWVLKETIGKLHQYLTVLNSINQTDPFSIHTQGIKAFIQRWERYHTVFGLEERSEFKSEKLSKLLKKEHLFLNRG